MISTTKVPLRLGRNRDLGRVSASWSGTSCLRIVIPLQLLSMIFFRKPGPSLHQVRGMHFRDHPFDRQTGPRALRSRVLRASQLFEEVSTRASCGGGHPRTTQINTRPITADMIPATRNEVSGLSIAVAASRLAAAGKAAKSSPSMTNTRPIATRNSAILGYCRVPVTLSSVIARAYPVEVRSMQRHPRSRPAWSDVCPPEAWYWPKKKLLRAACRMDHQRNGRNRSQA